MKMVGDSRWKKEEKERRATTSIEIARSGEGTFFKALPTGPLCSVLGTLSWIGIIITTIKG